MDKNRLTPFESDIENEKLNKLYNKSISPGIDGMVLSSNERMKAFLEIFCSSLILEFNKRLPEPNYSIYMTYRIKSSKSDIAKLSDYLKRIEPNEDGFTMKEFTDLIGLRVIIEKIPHNVSISKDNPEYEQIQKLKTERKNNIQLSEEFHDFAETIYSNSCTKFDYYSESAKLLKSLLAMLSNEEKANYAKDLKSTYNSLLSLCNENLMFLKSRGDYSSIISVSKPNAADSKISCINFYQLLEDFDSRIDGKLALKLYSSILPDILDESDILKTLGAKISDDPSRTKPKREPSGFVSDFKGLDFNGIPIKFELQFMSVDEYLASILGYSAHSNMPNKDPEPCELPFAYVHRNIELYNSIGDSNHLDSDQLKLLRILMDVKKLSVNDLSTLNNILNSLDSNALINGIDITEENQKKLKDICTLDAEQYSVLEDRLHKNGVLFFNSWAENICALHATARLDKDSSAKNRVKIDYDGPYERLAHVMRQQIEGYNLDPSKSDLVEDYLGDVYRNQESWFDASKTRSASIMDFEIQNYIQNDLFEFREFISNNFSIDDEFAHNYRNDDSEEYR